MMATTATMNLGPTENGQKERHVWHADIAMRRTSELAHRTTDEEINGFVRHALHSTGYQQIRNLKAHCDNGVVTLQGCVPTYYLKQVAQTTVLAVPGVCKIDNDVRVVSSW